VIIVAILVYVVALFLTEAVFMVFYGGMFEMVIGAARGGRGVHFGDLFAGFRKFGAYVVCALVMFGVSLGISAIGVIPVVGSIAGLILGLWISVIWLYVLPLIADHGLGFGGAAKRSNEMVKAVGWWRTFGLVVLLGLVIAAAVCVIILIAYAVGQASETAGILLGAVLFLAFTILVPPYSICFVSTMYLGSGGALAPAAGGSAASAPLPPSAGAPLPPSSGAPPSPPGVPPPPPPDAGTWATGPVVPVGPPPAYESPGPPAGAQTAVASEPLVWLPPGAGAAGIDAQTGRLEMRCTQCGALVEGSAAFCQACGFEVSGGETAATQPPPEPPGQP